MASTRGQPPEARARRAAGLLARKGYPPGLAYRLIKETLEREGAGASAGLDLDNEPYSDPDDPDADDLAQGPGLSREFDRQADYSL